MEIPPKLILLQKRLSFFLCKCVMVSDKTIVKVFMAVWKNLIVSKARSVQRFCVKLANNIWHLVKKIVYMISERVSTLISGTSQKVFYIRFDLEQTKNSETIETSVAMDDEVGEA